MSVGTGGTGIAVRASGGACVELIVLVLTALSLGALTYGTYLLARGIDDVWPVFAAVGAVWVGLYLITNHTRLRRRQRW